MRFNGAGIFDGAINGAAAIGDTLVGVGATLARRKNNDAAVVAPAVTDDSAAGYAIGSRWLDTTADKEYVAIDVSVGAAVWKETTGAGGGGSGTIVRITETTNSMVLSTTNTAFTTAFTHSHPPLDAVNILVVDVSADWLCYSTTEGQNRVRCAARVTKDFPVADTEIGLRINDIAIGGAVVSLGNSMNINNSFSLHREFVAGTTAAITFYLQHLVQADGIGDPLANSVINNSGGLAPLSQIRVIEVTP